MKRHIKLSFKQYIRLFLGAIALGVLLEVIGYQGLGHWIYGYFWDSDKGHEWTIHILWILVVNVPVIFWWFIRQFRTNRRYHLELSDWQGEFQSLFYHNSEGIVSFDLHGNITNANPAFEKMTGYPLDEIKGLHRNDFLPEERRQFAKNYFEKALSGDPQEFENILLHENGTAIHVFSRNIPIYKEGSVVGAYAILKNITERKRHEEEIWNMAHRDQLTGLANRRQFSIVAEQALVHSSDNALSLAVLFVDLDRFKNINDDLGHDIGDRVLTEIARRMSSCLRNDNVLARMGGDEFALLVPRMRNIEHAVSVADQLQELIRKPLRIDKCEFHLTSSIGIAIFPQSGDSVNELLKSADAAMYEAKRSGKGKTFVHTSSVNINSHRRFELESDLRQALEGQISELYVEYQPQVNIKTGQVIGAEALVRWQHPKMGVIEPAEFIPLAEDTGLITAVGDYVTRTVCQQIIMWRNQYATFSTPISINISPIQLQESNFASKFAAILREYNVPISAIWIEVTESSLVREEQTGVEQLMLLREFGFQIYVDDFGKGYSSIAFLKRFPLNGLKMDMLFTQFIDQDDDDAAIAEALVKLAHARRLMVIAEGVERQQQVDVLAHYGCDYYQGFFHSRPLKAAEFLITIRGDDEEGDAVWL